MYYGYIIQYYYIMSIYNPHLYSSIENETFGTCGTKNNQRLSVKM